MYSFSQNQRQSPREIETIAKEIQKDTLTLNYGKTIWRFREGLNRRETIAAKNIEFEPAIN